MTIPLQIVFHNMQPSEWITESIGEHARRLEAVGDRITRCRVVVDIPHKHHQTGNDFTVNISVNIPNQVITIQKQGRKLLDYDEVRATIRDAFDAARRKILNQ